MFSRIAPLLEFVRKHASPIALVSISAVAYAEFLSFRIFSSSDWVFQYAQTLRDMQDFGTWNAYGMGNPGIMLWRLFGPNHLLF